MSSTTNYGLNLNVSGTRPAANNNYSSHFSSNKDDRPRNASDAPRKEELVLKKGMFDDTAIQSQGKQKSEHGYIAGKQITDLQQNLIDMGFLKVEKPTGMFGEKTEKAIKDFQAAALKPDRLIKNGIALSKAPSITYYGKSDGMCDKNAQIELDLWKEKNWVKPVKSFKHGDTGHEVRTFQNHLQTIGVYIGKVADGWFWHKTKEAIEQFQKAAESGRFLVEGEPTDIGEKLSEYRKGELCVKTQEYLTKAAKMNAKVPPEQENSFDADKAIKYLKENAVPPYGEGKCATHVRKGILAGGIDITPNPVPAKEYGPYLEKYGFEEISTDSYNPVKGDVIVMQSFTGASSNYGHIEVYSGTNWISDFIQDDLYPGSKYKENKAEYHVYRWKAENK